MSRGLRIRCPVPSNLDHELPCTPQETVCAMLLATECMLHRSEHSLEFSGFDIDGSSFLAPLPAHLELKSACFLARRPQTCPSRRRVSSPLAGCVSRSHPLSTHKTKSQLRTPPGTVAFLAEQPNRQPSRRAKPGRPPNRTPCKACQLTGSLRGRGYSVVQMVSATAAWANQCPPLASFGAVKQD